jgi:peptidoglycan/xylan/chitin deacetylase (PgdA/CDA1 family)
MRTKGIKKIIKALIPAALIRYRGPSASNRVALTFDDGPVPGVTDEIVRGLTARGHRATFFVLGRKAESYPSLVNLIVDSGCEVGNHSYSHTRLTRVSYAQVADEVERTDRILESAVAGPSWFRPPGGGLSWRLVLCLRRRGTKASPVLWSVCVPHEHRKSEGEILNSLRMATPSSGDIVLLHDDHPTIVEALPAILDLLDENGLRSVPVSELLQSGLN